jgi:DNA-binding Lrp family transcriptional regulator
MALDDLDRRLINGWQGGFPLSERPFAEVGEKLGISEEEAISRISRLLESGYLTRFGPLFNAERMGGGLSLSALKVPEEDYERIAQIVNSFPEVAHNYAREHALNMWFVLATESKQRMAEVILEIEAATGLKVHDMPKIEEFFIGLHFEA